MPQQWTSRPDESQIQRACQIIRVKPGKPMRCIVLSHDLVGAQTHYHQRRTQICQGAACGICALNEKPRWYGYLSAMSLAGSIRVIVEVTPLCVPSIDEYFRDHGTLRGAQLSLERIGARDNAPIRSALAEGHFEQSRLPEPLPVIATLQQIWQLDTLDFQLRLPGDAIGGDAVSPTVPLQRDKRRKA